VTPNSKDDMMAYYRWINPNRIKARSRTQTVAGLSIEVELSPYHSPQGVSGEYSPTDGTFMINFEYIDDEPPASETTTIGDVLISEGKFTGKILSIALPIDSQPLEKMAVIQLKTIEQKVLGALRQREKRLLGKVDQELNQEAAEDALSELLVAQ
jgi:hypothetical protein